MKIRFISRMLVAALLLAGAVTIPVPAAEAPQPNAAIASLQAASPQEEVFPSQPAAEPITAGEAVDTALTQAGLSADQVKDLDTEFDVDDGVKTYEVQFEIDGYEYEYEIDAETGEILHKDVERDE